MRRLRLFVLFNSAILLLSCGSEKAEQSDNQFQVTADEMKTHVVPKQKGAVTDVERLFSPAQSDSLTAKCKQFESDYQIPVMVLTSADFGDFASFTEFADAVSEKWQICSKEQGILFVISSKLGEVRMISCPETEKKISDQVFDHVVNVILFGAFRQGRFSTGVEEALDYLGKNMTH